MMAFERTPSSSGLSPETVEALRETMRQALTRGEHDARLREVLVRAANEAHASQVTPEQLLVTLKGIWYSMPPMSANLSSEKATALLQELISRCIEQYYAR